MATTSALSLLATSLLVSSLYMVLILTLHVAASTTNDNELPFLQRIKEGPSQLTWMDLIVFFVIIDLGFELLSYVTFHIGPWMGAKQIPVRGKHLDDFSRLDSIFIHMNKLTAAPFVYLYLRYAYYAPNVSWQLEDCGFANAVLTVPLLFIVYDFFYTILHGGLHIKGIYGLIHKHHHHQKAPSRGNTDAINVHPIEYILGEFNHLFALYLVSTFLCRVHIVAVLAFVIIGGFLASFNHTRDDLVFFGGLYDSKAHDVHHRIPQSNYGQYTMFWDKVIRTYRPYNPKDRINPKAQLNLKTGKSLEWSNNNSKVASSNQKHVD